MKLFDTGNLSAITLFKRAFKQFNKDDMGSYSAALAYAALFALFPFVIFLISLLGFLQIPEFFDWLLEQAQSALPADAYRRAAEILEQIQNQSQGGFLSFGALAAIWSASSGFRSLMNALNIAYDVEETRSLPKRYILSILYTLGAAALLIVAIGLMAVGPQAVEWLADQAGLGSLFVTLWTWLRIPVAIVLLMMAAAFLYYVAPNVDQRFQFITPGAILAVLVWIIASIGFSIYVANFSNYSATYGSLGGIIIVLFYFYISAAVLLLGAEINAEVRKSRVGESVPQD